MIRTLYPMPGPVDWEALVTELSALVPILGVNQVESSVAVYTAEALADPDAVGAVVAAHTPSPPPVDPLHLLAQAIVEATTLADLVPVAQQILADGDA